MKAYEILMFLLIFNLVLWLLGGYGLNLYNVGVYGNKTGLKEGTDILERQSPLTTTDIGIAFLWEISGVAFLTIITGTVSLAIAGYLLRAIPTPQSIIYFLFSGLFWTSYLKTIQVFFNISKGFPFIFFIILLVFTAITIYTFISGFSQMVAGSWGSMK